MTEHDKTASVFQAGFDLTDIPIPKWQKLLEELKIADGVVTELRRDWTDAVMRHWTWSASDGFIVTKCNPVTGEHLDQFIEDLRPGDLSYVGIEGTKEFVDKVFKYIKRHASDYKDCCYGKRPFI